MKLTLFVTFVLTFATTLAADDAPRPRRFIYNSDADNMFIYVEPPMKAADVNRYVDEIAVPGVTTLSISPNVGMAMNFAGRHAPLLGSEASAEEWTAIENGARKSCTLERGAVNFKALIADQRDPLGLVIDRAREKELEAFISFRLNEVHGVDTPEAMPYKLIVSNTWRQHPEWRIGKPGDRLSPLYTEILGPRTHPVVASWLPGGLNFALADVRALTLKQLRECCERYNIDGLELDFQRFPMYFKPGEEAQHVATMTAWMREIRAMTREVAQRRGRPILLSARVLARPEQNVGIGIDPTAWAKAGLVDFLIASHYLHNNFPLPIKEYRALLPATMPLYASIEVEPKAEDYRRIASQLYGDGADGLMVFNYFTCRERGVEPDFALLTELSRLHQSSPAPQVKEKSN